MDHLAAPVAGTACLRVSHPSCLYRAGDSIGTMCSNALRVRSLWSSFGWAHERRKLQELYREGVPRRPRERLGNTPSSMSAFRRATYSSRLIARTAIVERPTAV